MALRGSSAGASLPSSPRFPLQHFCRAKTPQDFSARENQMMARKRTPAYWRMPRTMTQSALICTAEKRVCPCQAKVPSLDKSTYGFCGHKCRMALRGSSAGASLPSSPRFPLQHFCRAKTPQDFSARENQMMARKRTPAYWRMPRTMTQSALICTAEKRVCPCQAKVFVKHSI